jgi:hypothetical protein
MEKSEDYQSGWADGYDTSEEQWANNAMVIARRLLDRVNAEATIQGYLDIDSIESVVGIFWGHAEQGEMIDILDQYIKWCENSGSASDMKKLVELKLTGRLSNA